MEKEIIGIDIAKNSFVVARRDASSNKVKTQTYSSKTKADVLKFVAEYEGQNVHFVMEYTSIYYKKVAYILLQKGYDVSVLDSGKSKLYGQLQNRGTKTDKTDAAVLLLFGEREMLQKFSLPSEESEETKQKRAHLGRLKKRLGAVNNQLEMLEHEFYPDKQVRGMLQAEKEMYEEQIKKLEEILNLQCTEADKEILKKLEAINGVGAVTALALLVCSKSMADFCTHTNSKKMAKFVGLSPSVSQSGKQYKKSSLTSAGQKPLRQCLYMGARSAVSPRVKQDNVFRTFFLNLRERGKSYKEALTATMHKILRVAFAIIRYDRTFDPNYLAKV